MREKQCGLKLYKLFIVSDVLFETYARGLLLKAKRQGLL